MTRELTTQEQTAMDAYHLEQHPVFQGAWIICKWCEGRGIAALATFDRKTVRACSACNASGAMHLTTFLNEPFVSDIAG